MPNVINRSCGFICRREQAVNTLEMLSSLHSRRDNGSIVNGKASAATAVPPHPPMIRQPSDDFRYSKCNTSHTFMRNLKRYCP